MAHDPGDLRLTGDYYTRHFTREGGEAYLRDLPNAEMHRLDSGHFAVEDCLDEIAGHIRRFYDEKVEPASRPISARRAA